MDDLALGVLDESPGLVQVLQQADAHSHVQR